jgi:hypothetical protein
MGYKLTVISKNFYPLSILTSATVWLTSVTLAKIWTSASLGRNGPTIGLKWAPSVTHTLLGPFFFPCLKHQHFFFMPYLATQTTNNNIER